MSVIRKSIVPVESDVWFRDRPARIIGESEKPGGPSLPERIIFTDQEGGEPDYSSLTIAEWVEIARALQEAELEALKRRMQSLEADAITMRDRISELETQWVPANARVSAMRSR